ncbi:ribonuclease E activity regulator RraA [Salinactinospora qingdaonensis]|uniref:4-hydroxy-4-methyl-2-oxoglutarate aldolase n=1 Tax=Salinactinospora qingdaonensis TaxID=702744 RepID=A0ABP7F224_9ACTN
MADDRATADLIDAYGDTIASCQTQLRSFGARDAFHGPISTVWCRADNGLVKSRLNEPGAGHVLVVDGGASLRSALMGDMIAAAAVQNGWAGVVINGAVRDVAALAQLPLGIKALGSNPRKSAKAGEGAVDVPVSFGDALFTPGAWLYSDEDGIVISPEPLAAP